MDLRAGEEGPAGADPDEEFSSGTVGLEGGEIAEGLGADLELLHPVVETLVVAELAEAGLGLFEEVGGGVSVLGGLRGDLDAGVGEDDERDGLGEVASVLSEVAVDLRALVREAGDADVDGVDEEDGLDGFGVGS
jgi:hypothetical protein